MSLIAKIEAEESRIVRLEALLKLAIPTKYGMRNRGGTARANRLIDEIARAKRKLKQLKQPMIDRENKKKKERQEMLAGRAKVRISEKKEALAKLSRKKVKEKKRVQSMFARLANERSLANPSSGTKVVVDHKEAPMKFWGR